MEGKVDSGNQSRKPKQKTTGARALYQACGFAEEAVLPDFYDDGDAILCVKVLE